MLVWYFVVRMWIPPSTIEVGETVIRVVLSHYCRGRDLGLVVCGKVDCSLGEDSCLHGEV